MKSALLLGVNFLRATRGLMFGLLNAIFAVLFDAVTQAAHDAHAGVIERVCLGIYGLAILGVLIGLFDVVFGLAEMREQKR